MKKQLLAIALLGIAANSCDMLQKEKELASGIDLESMDTSVKPGDDFNAYVSGTWVKNNEIPGDEGRYGAFNILRKKSDEDVRKIIEESAAGEFEKGSDQQKIGDLFNSYLDMETRNQLGVSPMDEDLARIDAISNYSELAKAFAYNIKHGGLGSPLVHFVTVDIKNPKAYTVAMYQSGLGLGDRDYYFNSDERSKEIREKYIQHIANMFEVAGWPGGENAAQTVMALETKIAAEHMDKVQRRKSAENYRKYSKDSLKFIMKNFDWDTYLSEAGVQDEEAFVTYMTDYQMALDGIIAETPLADWKTYLKWHLLRTSASSLNEALDQKNFEFYSKELTGVTEMRPMWRRGVSTVNGTLGELVGKVYVQEHFPPEAKERMEVLVGNLLKAYEASIKELDWMGEETKVQALDKLSKFDPKIGYPNKWKEYNVDIAADDLYGNLKRASVMNYQRNIEKLGGPIDREEWGMNPQTVNAYYNPTKNEIVFPAAILQPPFFNMEADDAVNYGAIGGVIGHEIGHGFDDQGSTYDGDGMARNWWTDSDREEFKERTGKLIAQYDAYEVLPGVNVNGAFTLGENIGDLGGLSIALKAYKMSLEGEEGPEMDGFTAEQRVFLGWAQVWQQLARDEFLRRQVTVDPHSPAEFRVNGVVRNIPEFYTAFNVQEGDSLYLPEEERVKIW